MWEEQLKTTPKGKHKTTTTTTTTTSTTTKKPKKKKSKSRSRSSVTKEALESLSPSDLRLLESILKQQVGSGQGETEELEKIVLNQIRLAVSTLLNYYVAYILL